MTFVSRSCRFLLVASVAVGLCVVVGEARAEPQVNTGLTVGGAAVGVDGGFFEQPEFVLGLKGDVMFGRDDPWDFGVGPYLELGTFAFDELQLGAGASVHLPIHETFPFVASVGPYARYGDDPFGLEPGIAAALFWGSRSYNFHDNYIMAVGLSVGYRASFGESKASALLVNAHVDLALLGLPFVALVGAIAGPSEEAATID